MPFDIRYDPEVKGHVLALGRRWSGLIRKTIEERLMHEPTVQTTNRKPLHEPAVLIDAWEIRFGPRGRFRVFYRTDAIRAVVSILAVGEKRGSRLYIGGKESEP